MKKRVVGYCRYSSYKQSDSNTIETQKLAIIDFCKKNDYELLCFYSDLAKTGREAEHRTDFKKMISSVMIGGIDSVVVYTRDRFSRSIKDFLKYLSIMRENNCELECVIGTSDSESSTGVLSEWIIMSIAQYYVENLSREVARGLLYNAKNGKWNGIAPLGYDIDSETKRLVINEKEAEAVRIIFKMYNEGFKEVEIASYLNENGYRTKKGNYFGRKLYDYLKSRKYIGEYQYHITVNGEEKEILIKGGIPRIVSDEEFLNAEKRSRRHRPAKLKYRKKQLLFKKIKCGYSGNSYCAKYPGRGELFNYNFSYSNGNDCIRQIKTAKPISGILLNDFIQLFIEEILLDNKNKNKLYHLLKDSINEYRAFLVSSKKEIISRIERTKQKQEEILINIQLPDCLDLQEQLESLKNYNDVMLILEEDLLTINFKLEDQSKFIYNDFVRKVAELKKVMQEDRFKAVQSIINIIILYDENLTVVINSNAFLNVLNTEISFKDNDFCFEVKRDDLEKLVDGLCEKKVSFESFIFRRYIKVNET